jgi:hypothetical protein
MPSRHPFQSRHGKRVNLTASASCALGSLAIINSLSEETLEIPPLLFTGHSAAWVVVVVEWV